MMLFFLGLVTGLLLAFGLVVFIAKVVIPRRAREQALRELKEFQAAEKAKETRQLRLVPCPETQAAAEAKRARRRARNLAQSN